MHVHARLAASDTVLCPFDETIYPGNKISCHPICGMQRYSKKMSWHCNINPHFQVVLLKLQHAQALQIILDHRNALLGLEHAPVPLQQGCEHGQSTQSELVRDYVLRGPGGLPVLPLNHGLGRPQYQLHKPVTFLNETANVILLMGRKCIHIQKLLLSFAYLCISLMLWPRQHAGCKSDLPQIDKRCFRDTYMCVSAS